MLTVSVPTYISSWFILKRLNAYGISSVIFSSIIDIYMLEILYTVLLVKIGKMLHIYCVSTIPRYQDPRFNTHTSCTFLVHFS